MDVPEPDVPLADLPEEPVTEIPDSDVPRSGGPEEPEEEIPDEDVPLADAPETGDGSLKWYAMALLSAAALAVIGLLKKKENEE